MIYIQSVRHRDAVFIRLTPEGQILGTLDGPSALSVKYHHSLSQGATGSATVSMHMIEFDPHFHRIDENDPATMDRIRALIGPDPHSYLLSGESARRMPATRCNGEGAMEWHRSGETAKL